MTSQEEKKLDAGTVQETLKRIFPFGIYPPHREGSAEEETFDQALEVACNQGD